MVFPKELGLHRSYCEIDDEALTHNMQALRERLAKGAEIGAVVKANAYGHGFSIAWRALLRGGADWMCVDSLHEAEELRTDGYTGPIFVMGHVPPAHADAVLKLDVRLIVYDKTQVDALGRVSNEASQKVKLLLKFETGTNRQGLDLEKSLALAEYIARFPYLEIEGCCTHFANIEDTTDHSYAKNQEDVFDAMVDAFKERGITFKLRTIANSAATILWPKSHYELTRPGIVCYGMWPSNECLISAREHNASIELKPALTWKTYIAQVKMVCEGQSIGYGCTFKTSRKTRLGILPVGYYDGYHRALSNRGYVLIRGKRAPICGRICMNMCMVDLSDIEGVEAGEEVVLLGRQGTEVITAELLGAWTNTINYEVVSQIQTTIPRIAKSALKSTPLDV